MIEQSVPWDTIEDTRKKIIERKAEVESISDRVIQLEKENDAANYDDLHKARMKLKHVKETVVDLEKKAVEHNILLLKFGLITSLPND